jgi:hypothetical protein
MLNQFIEWTKAQTLVHDEARESVQHRVKSWPQFFQPIFEGLKTHDLRRKDDRDYRVGDTMLLMEYDPRSESYTGRELEVRITYVTSAEYPCAYSVGGGLSPNLGILSITRV